MAGSKASAASGQLRETMLKLHPTWNLQLSIRLPLGFDLVSYSRAAGHKRLDVWTLT